MRAEGPLTAPPLLLIGVGNRHRGDDAVGPLAVEDVRERLGETIRAVLVDGDIADLAMRWLPNQDVVIVDAIVSQRPAGTIVEFDALGSRLSRSDPLLSSHGLGLVEAIELARLIDRLPRSLRVVGIEAKSLDHMAPLSDEVAAAMPVLVERILKLTT